ncbi:hypothetical protein, partial [Effusibacillus consociatus]
MKRTVIAGLENQAVYQNMVEFLERPESGIELEIGRNFASQATFLYFWLSSNIVLPPNISSGNLQIYRT